MGLGFVGVRTPRGVEHDEDFAVDLHKLIKWLRVGFLAQNDNIVRLVAEWLLWKRWRGRRRRGVRVFEKRQETFHGSQVKIILVVFAIDEELEGWQPGYRVVLTSFQLRVTVNRSQSSKRVRSLNQPETLLT